MVNVTLGSKNDGAGFTRDYSSATPQRLNYADTVSYTSGHVAKEAGIWVRSAPASEVTLNVGIYDITSGRAGALLVHETTITIPAEFSGEGYVTKSLSDGLPGLSGGETLAFAVASSSGDLTSRRVPVSTSSGPSGATLNDPWSESSTSGTEAPDGYFILGDSSPQLSAPASISPGETIAFTCSFAPTSVTASDGTSTMPLSNIVNTSGDNYTADVPALPAVGNSLQYTTFGAVTMSATDGTDTAEDTTTLAEAAGQTVTILAETFDTSELSYLFNFGGTPATGDQFIEGSPQLALDANGGYVADTDGTYVITGIDATDGVAQSYNLILGDVPVDPPAGIGRITRRNLTRRALTRRSLTARS